MAAARPPADLEPPFMQQVKAAHDENHECESKSDVW